MRERDNRPSIGCAVLAAGAGTRFGRPGEKLVARARGKPLVQHAIDAACESRATHCSVILGAGAEAVLAAVDPRRASVYANDGWARGLSSSIAVATGAHAGDDALVLLLGDAPGVTCADVDALIDAWLRRRDRAAALRRGTIWGAPAIFPRSRFEALAGLRGDRGAKGSALLPAGRTTFVESTGASAFVDVDRRADLSRLSARKTM